jgi:hypothetical protein
MDFALAVPLVFMVWGLSPKYHYGEDIWGIMEYLCLEIALPY